MKILHILSYIDGGGIDSVVFNYFSHMNKEGMDLHLIAIGKEKPQFREEQFKQIGFKIHYVPKSIFHRIKSIDFIIKAEKFDIIHSHCEFLSEIYLWIAKKHGVKIRIMHSHIANSKLSFIKRIYKPIGHFIAKKTANYFFGCGSKAAISLWGEKFYKQGKCYVMNNAIDTALFSYSLTDRLSIRQKLSIESKRVFITVARLTPQKNLFFLVKLFKYIHDKHNDTTLLLVGEGELSNAIQALIKELDLQNYVHLLGNRKDIPMLLSAADCFILPSLFEGFPVVAVEAQTNGLPIVMSENITKECGITNLATFISLSESFEIWEKNIMKVPPSDRILYRKYVEDAHFEIRQEADKLKSFYQMHLIEQYPINLK